MKNAARLVGIAAVGFVVYWFLLRGGCGTSGAIACADPMLEQGVGVSLNAAEVCPRAGYLCAERRTFQVARWPLEKGKLRVRVPLPDFVAGDAGLRFRDAAIEGIKEWDGHPFPIVIDTGKLPFRPWDIGVVWSQGLFNAAAGVARVRAVVDGKRMAFDVDGLAVVVPPISAFMAMGMLPPDLEASFLSQTRAAAMHEMGHSLGLMHSDSEEDIMFFRMRSDTTGARASPRDLLTVDALYTLPNGAMVQ